MAQNRRAFLQALGAGVAVMSLPEISPIFNWLGFPGGPDEDLATTLRRLLLGRSAGGAFTAQADAAIIEGPPQRLLSPQAALLNMCDCLKIGKSFSDQMSYARASQCKEHFKRQEDVWRQHYGFGAFTDVARSPSDSDVAMAIGGNIDSRNYLVAAAGAIQFKAKPAVPLVKHDAAAVVAGWWLTHKNATEKELAQKLAVFEKQNVTMSGGQTATRYETPGSAVVYIPRRRPESRVPGAVAFVAANSKQEPDRIYVADLVA